MTKPNRSNEIDAIVRDELAKWHPGIEFWAADIADATSEPTQQVFRSLERLARQGEVMRVTMGNPSSWTCAHHLDTSPSQHQMH